MNFQIEEIHESQASRAGAYRPRGAGVWLFDTTNHNYFERITSGPAETGKTYAWCQYLDALCWMYPRSQYVMARKTYKSIIGTCLDTYKEILGENSPVKPYGGEKPEWFQYPNGSRLWIAGLDNPGKALSSQRDGIYINQVEEIKLDEWEILTTRVTGRGSRAPVTWIGGDCNPGPPTHWIKQRSRAGGPLHLRETRHEDNPTLFDDDGNITAQGRKSLAILDALTGNRKQRLRYGRWVQAEGVVYDSFDLAKHRIKRMPSGWTKWTKIRTTDFGYTNPFVTQWWAIDPDGRMYLYREIYYTNRIVADHVIGFLDPDDQNKILAPGIEWYSQGERYEASVADHDSEDRATMAKLGIRTTPAYKAIDRGIQAVQARLKIAGDGKPRIFLLEDALVEVDPELSAKHKPTSTLEEFDSYVWPEGKSGKNKDETPVKEYDHGMDAMRYAVAYVDRLNAVKVRSARVMTS